MKQKDVLNIRLWRRVLHDFRQKHGAEAYDCHILGKACDVDPLLGYIGTSLRITTHNFVAPYASIRAEMRRIRERAADRSEDRIATGSWRKEAAGKFSDALRRWQISYRSVEVSAGGGMPSISVSGRYDRVQCVISPGWSMMTRDIGHLVDNMLILDVRNRRTSSEHIVADAIVLANARSAGGGGFTIKSRSGWLAWLPDAASHSIAFSESSEAVAVRTSKMRMIRFIDKKLKGESNDR